MGKEKGNKTKQKLLQTGKQITVLQTGKQIHNNSTADRQADPQ